MRTGTTKYLVMIFLGLTFIFQPAKARHHYWSEEYSPAFEIASLPSPPHYTRPGYWELDIDWMVSRTSPDPANVKEGNKTNLNIRSTLKFNTAAEGGQL